MSTTEKRTQFLCFNAMFIPLFLSLLQLWMPNHFDRKLNKYWRKREIISVGKRFRRYFGESAAFSRICRSFSARVFFCVRLFCLLHVNWKQNKKKMEKSSRCPRSDDRGHGTSHCGSSLRMIRSNSFNDASLSIVPVKLNIQTSKMNKKCDYWMHNEPQHEKKKQNHFSDDFTAAPFGWDKSLSNGPTLNQIQTNALRIIHRLYLNYSSSCPLSSATMRIRRNATVGVDAPPKRKIEKKPVEEELKGRKNRWFHPQFIWVEIFNLPAIGLKIWILIGF